MQFTKLFTLAVLAVSVSAQAALKPDDAAPKNLLSTRSAKTTETHNLKLTVCLAKKKDCKVRTTGEISEKQKKNKELYPLKFDKCYNFGKKYNDKVRFIQVESEIEVKKKDGKEEKIKTKDGKGCCRFYRKHKCGGGEIRKQKDGDKKEEVRWFQKSISSFRCEEKC